VDVDARYLSEPGPIGLFTRLARVGLLVDAFQHRCLDRFGLRFVDYSVLRVLRLSGAPYRMAPSELGDIVLRSSGGMTKVLDRLQNAGLVERAADPTGGGCSSASPPRACAQPTVRAAATRESESAC
jgi:hypothetical protein